MNSHWIIGTPLQSTNYYPYGLEIPVYGDNDNQIKYNSKELQNEADHLLPRMGEVGRGLNGASFYDPVIGRWHVVDPMAEKSDSVPKSMSVIGKSPFSLVLSILSKNDNYTTLLKI